MPVQDGHAPRIRVAASVFAASAAVYAVLAAPIPFYDKGEPREALVVQAVLRDGAVILPRREGILPSKPPLFHWLAALAVRTDTLPEELALRLPSVVLGAAGVALTFEVAARAHGVCTGLIAALVLGTSFEWLRSATQSRVDMTLTFFVLVATLAWREAVAAAGGRWWVRLGYLCATAAVLTKGPVGLVLPMLIVFVDVVTNDDRRRLRRLADFPSAAVMVAVCAGWYALAWNRGGIEFAGLHLVRENVQRFVGWGNVPHRHAITYYLPVLAGAFLPWTMALPSAARRVRREWGRVDRFLLVWILTVLGFFSLAAGKRSSYILPLFPPLAILAAAGLSDTVRLGVRPSGRQALRAGAAVTLAVGLFVGLDATPALVDGFTGLLEGSDVARLPAALAVVREQRAAITAMLATIGVSLVILSGRGRTPAWRLGALVAIALSASAGLTAFGTYPTAVRLTSRDFARRVRTRLRDGDALCSCGAIDWPLRYYLRRTVPPCPRTASGGRGSLLVIRRAASSRVPSRYRLERASRGGGSPCRARAATSLVHLPDGGDTTQAFTRVGVH